MTTYTTAEFVKALTAFETEVKYDLTLTGHTDSNQYGLVTAKIDLPEGGTIIRTASIYFPRHCAELVRADGEPVWEFRGFHVEALDDQRLAELVVKHVSGTSHVPEVI